MEYYYKHAFFSTLIILIIVFPIYFLYQRRKYRNINDNRSRVSKVASLLTIAYLVAVIAVLIVPYWQFLIFGAGQVEFYFLDMSERVLNIIPFKTLLEQINGIRHGEFGLPFLSLFNILVNLCIFIPLPILLKLSYKRIPLPIAILITLIFSFVCEFIQYFIGRSSDIDDLILNTLGSIIGCVIYLIAERILKKHINKKHLKSK